MNLLIEDAPRQLCGCPINTDFRAMVQLELLIRDPDIPAVDKIPQALALLFTKDCRNLNAAEAWEALLWYYGGGDDKDPAEEEEPAQRPAGAKARKPARPRRVYDFEQDADRIYAAFRQVYGVDLQREPLHWWEFRAMLFALPDSCLQGRIMAYRATDTSKLKGAEKKRIQHLQRVYAIKDTTVADAQTTAERERQMLRAVRTRYEEAKKWLEKKKQGNRWPAPSAGTGCRCGQDPGRRPGRSGSGARTKHAAGSLKLNDRPVPSRARVD